MPTFKKSKSLKGLFTDQQIASAVNDVMKNGLKVREAARKYNLCHTTISRYIKRIRKSEIDANQIRKISMVTMQVSKKCLSYLKAGVVILFFMFLQVTPLIR